MTARRSPRRLSARSGRWLLSLYPPFLFQRIRVVEIAPEFRSVTVRVSKSLLNRNLNGTIFGGTIYSAADPIYVLMIWQAFAHRGVFVRAWLRRGGVRYLKPAASRLTLRFELSDELLERATRALDAGETFRETFTTPAVDREGQTCAEIETEVDVRPRHA